jgi:hypothetical protein
MSKETWKKIGSIALNVLFYAFIVVGLFAIIVSITSKKDPDGTANIFGYQMRFVQSDSMGKSEYTDVSQYKIKSIPIMSLIFIETVPEDSKEAEEWYSNLAVGDVLTFKYEYARQETITHRITDIQYDGYGGYVITLKGDNKTSENSETLEQVINTAQTTSPNYVVGKVVGTSYLLGLLVYAVKQPLGIILIIILPCVLIIGYEVIKIVKMFNKEKKAKAEIEHQETLDELEKLKRELALLKGENKSEIKSNELTEETSVKGE